MRTIEAKDSDREPKSKTRHHTQPRSYQRAFGLTSDYVTSNKGVKPGPYITPLQPRIKSGHGSTGPIDDLSSIRREINNQPYRSMVPQSTPAKYQKTISIKNKRNSPSMAAGTNILTSIPSASSGMQLQGRAVRPEHQKYTSFAGNSVRGSNLRSN